ncbi:hypothetical protein FKM82_016237 [Ascaphus truei]
MIYNQIDQIYLPCTVLSPSPSASNTCTERSIPPAHTSSPGQMPRPQLPPHPAGPRQMPPPPRLIHENPCAVQHMLINPSSSIL